MSIIDSNTRCPHCRLFFVEKELEDIVKAKVNDVLYFLHEACVKDFGKDHQYTYVSKFGNGLKGAFYWLLAFVFLIYLYTHLFIFYLIFTALSIQLGSYFEHYLMDLDSFYSLGLLGFISGIFLYTFFIYKYRKVINKVRDDIDLAYWLWVSFVILYILVAVYIITIFTNGSY